MQRSGGAAALTVLISGLGGLAMCELMPKAAAGGVNPPPPTDTIPKLVVLTEGHLPTTPLPKEAVPARNTLFKLRTLNGSDPEHGQIYRAERYCYVHLPFTERPTSWRPPTKKSVDCPVEMVGFEWTQCLGGMISKDVDNDRCVCAADGNPPPPAKWVHCPESAEIGF